MDYIQNCDGYIEKDLLNSTEKKTHFTVYKMYTLTLAVFCFIISKTIRRA
jgi:hypothetical protein